MKKNYHFLKSFLILFLPITYNVFAQDTFSICAWDSATGQVGSAGATCIASASVGVSIISDVHPGVGVIHTQAYWLAANQNYGKYLMNLGTLLPQQILDSMLLHDGGGGRDSTYRQYGIVDMVHHQTAQFTGTHCDNYKNHIHGTYYSIQGNTLSFLGDTLQGQHILDSIESGFLNTQGTLACRLMAALQKAKLPAADVRCAPYNISTFSAILRVANPTDAANALYLNLYVNTYPPNAPAYMDPIDSLQKVFDAWGGCARTFVSSPSKTEGMHLYPNPSTNILKLKMEGVYGINAVEILNPIGEKVKSSSYNDEKEISVYLNDLKDGVYFLKVKTSNGEWISSKIMKQ